MLAPYRKYKSALEKVALDVSKALEHIYPEKKLWKVTELDSARLTRLLVWSERYGISLEYILEVLLGHYYSTLPKLRRAAALRSRSLGIKVASLVGDYSLSVLLEHMQSDFPDGNNLAAFKEQEKERIADSLDEELPRKSKSVLQFATMDKFVSAYVRSSEIRREGTRRIANKMRKVKWRGNPWL